jgi:hypothetical protein
MNINEVYQLINYIANKEQTGNTFKPAQFNLLAKVAQLDFINKRLGNIKTLDPNRVPQFGYKSTRKIDVDLRPLVYGPIQVPIASSGNFVYPYGFMWPDSVHKNDFSTIKEVDSDEYPFIKKSTVVPPTSDYPIIIYRNPYGFIDPYSIGSFSMSYVKAPPDPAWGFTDVSGTEVYNPATSVDFSVNPYTNAHMEISMIILAMVGINLSMDQITAYAVGKEQSTS